MRGAIMRRTAWCAMLTLLGVFVATPVQAKKSGETALRSTSRSEPNAPAGGTKGRVVLMPVEGDRLAIPSLSSELDASFRAQGMKVEVAKLQLDELMLAVGCSNRTIACMQKMGKMIGASGLIFADVGGRVAEGCDVNLRWFDVSTGADIQRVHQVLPLDPNQRRSEIVTLVRMLLGKEVGRKQDAVVGELVVEVNVTDVEIRINDQARGMAPLHLVNMPEGRYQIEAVRPGYVNWIGATTVQGGKKARLRIKMVPAPAGGSDTPGFFSSIRPLTWVTGAAGVGALIVGVGFGAHMLTQQDEFDSNPGATQAQLRQLQDLKDTGGGEMRWSRTSCLAWAVVC